MNNKQTEIVLRKCADYLTHIKLWTWDLKIVGLSDILSSNNFQLNRLKTRKHQTKLLEDMVDSYQGFIYESLLHAQSNISDSPQSTRSPIRADRIGKRLSSSLITAMSRPTHVSAGYMLDQRLRRLPNMEPALCQCRGYTLCCSSGS